MWLVIDWFQASLILSKPSWNMFQFSVTQNSTGSCTNAWMDVFCINIMEWSTWNWLFFQLFFVVVVVPGDCLLDQPGRQLSLPDNLPGASYSLHSQCELAFGDGSKPCPYMQPCSKLWCTGKAHGQLVCQTRHFPWADGTSCGTGRVCYQGICTEKNTTIHIKVWYTV